VDSKGSAFSRRAFNKTLRERGDRIPLLYGHDKAKVIGKAQELRSDSKGLFFNARVVEETFWGKEVMSLVRAGAISGASFGFRSVKERPGRPTDNIDLSEHRGVQPEEIRFIEEVSLHEISIEPFPSNPRAGITSVRSEDPEEALYEIIESLRSMDLTGEQIDMLTAEIRSLADTESDDEPSDDTRSADSRHSLDIEIELALIEVGNL
jgi:HK97 family phage prohead protease